LCSTHERAGKIALPLFSLFFVPNGKRELRFKGLAASKMQNYNAIFSLQSRGRNPVFLVERGVLLHKCCYLSLSFLSMQSLGAFLYAYASVGNCDGWQII